MDEDELEAEIAKDDGSAEEPPGPAPKRRRPPPEAGGGIPSWLKVSAVFALLGGGVAFLLWGTDANGALTYSYYVDEIMVSPDEYRDRDIRIEGQLQEGSVQFVTEPECEHTFVLTRGGFDVPVRFPRCVVPDTFRDDMPMDVVVEGRLQADNEFLASEVIPRCPSKYEMQERQQNGEDMPHEMPGAAS